MQTRKGEKELCDPAVYDEFCDRVLRPFANRFWHESFAAPRVLNFKARVDRKPNARLQVRQPYNSAASIKKGLLTSSNIKNTRANLNGYPLASHLR